MRGDGEEGLGQRVGRLPHGHLALLHRLQQRGLGLRRSAVDFVGQQNIGEDRPFHEAEVPPPLFVFLQHIGAGDVGGHQVGRKLDPLELDVEDSRQGADHQGFGQAWHAYQEAMPPGEDGGEDLFDDLRLAHDDLLQFLLHEPPVLAELLQHVAQTAWLNGGQGKSLILKYLGQMSF